MDGVSADHEFERPPGSKSWAVFKVINRDGGVPRLFTVEGSLKCLTCDGWTVDDTVCQECRQAIALLRSGIHMQALESLLSMLIEHPEFILFFEQMSTDVIANYFLDRIRQTPRD
jgi:hypothetical protein